MIERALGRELQNKFQTIMTMMILIILVEVVLKLTMVVKMISSLIRMHLVDSEITRIKEKQVIRIVTHLV